MIYVNAEMLLRTPLFAPDIQQRIHCGQALLAGKHIDNVQKPLPPTVSGIYQGQLQSASRE
ncbi:hypothetical protein KMT30_46735, partial [Streptomyces sp. IBSBF 2953]|nr:hypothetical protein [Streptomyces hayashii]